MISSNRRPRTKLIKDNKKTKFSDLTKDFKLHLQKLAKSNGLIQKIEDFKNTKINARYFIHNPIFDYKFN